MAYGEDGVARGAMGADAADYDRSGRPHCSSAISPTRCWASITTRATGCSWTKRRASAVGRASLLILTFGVFFFDYDLDGYPDIFAANGHIEDQIGRVQPKMNYASRRCCSAIWATASSRTSGAMGADFNRPWWRAARPMPIIDRDGDLDLLISTNNGPAVCSAMTAAIAITGCSVRLAGTKIEPRRHRRGGAASTALRASSGAPSAAARATARRATWR